MAVTYDVLWKALEDREISREELQNRAQLSDEELECLVSDAELELEVFQRIHRAFGLEIPEMMRLI